jgi:hypothetical protein
MRTLSSPGYTPPHNTPEQSARVEAESRRITADVAKRFKCLKELVDHADTLSVRPRHERQPNRP